MPRPKKSNRSDGRFEIQRTVGYDPNGGRIIKSFYGASKDAAQQKYQEYLLELEKRNEEKKRMSFELWVTRWLNTYKKPDVKPTTFISTYDRPCRNYIVPYFKDCFIQDITQVHIKEFLNTLTDLSQSLIDKIIICLRGIFESAIDNDIISKNPCRNITCKSKQQKEKKRTYDSESVDALCKSEHKYGILVHILLRMGLRCSELCGLRWEDIDFKEGTITVKQALTTEGGLMLIGKPKSANSIRKLDIPEDLFKRLKAEGEGKTGYIAILNGHHIKPNHFNQLQLEAFYNSMKVPMDQRLTAHELRHTCGTLLYESTKDIYFVSRYLGHSDIGITTKIYVHSKMQDEKIHIDFAK